MIEGIFLYRFFWGDFRYISYQSSTLRMRQYMEEHPEYEPIDIIGFINIKNRHVIGEVQDSLSQFYPRSVSGDVIEKVQRELDADMIYLSRKTLRDFLKKGACRENETVRKNPLSVIDFPSGTSGEKGGKNIGAFGTCKE